LDTPRIGFLTTQTRFQVFTSTLKMVPSRPSEISPGSSVGIVLGYGLDDSSTVVRNPVGAGNFPFLSIVYRRIFPGGYRVDSVMPRSQLLLLPRSRMRGAMPPLQYCFMAWCLDKHRDNLSYIYLNNILDATNPHPPPQKNYKF
jgi:hypothetical protein